MPSNTNQKRVALVVGSGSIKCTAALGLLKVLEREGIGIDLIVGTSAGSIYATVIALGYDAAAGEQMTNDLWTRELTAKRNRKAILELLLPKAFGFDGRFGLIDDTLIMERLNKAFGNRTFADAKIPLYIIATDFMSGEQVILQEGRLVDSIRGSIAIPFIFKPWPVNGRLMIDGLLADPLPVDVAIREGADVIIALGFESPVQKRVDSVIRFAFQVTTIMSNNLLRSNFAFHNIAHHTEILSILPEFEERIGPFDTTRIPYLIEKGAQAMEDQLPYLNQLLGLQKDS
jgi:NTE family protein